MEKKKRGQIDGRLKRAREDEERKAIKRKMSGKKNRERKEGKKQQKMQRRNYAKQDVQKI